MAVEAEDMAARLRAEFPHALRSGQVVAYYQPEVELSSGRVVAAESLARWEHPELGTLPPALFTPVAEKLGLMGELTRLMLRLSLAQHRAWAAAGWVVPVSVNVGPDCVTDPGFPAVIAEFLRREQVSGPMLDLEVSEQTGTDVVSSSFFAQLAECGVRVALDDFGTGFASLESLGGWPVDELKLDMSLVRPIASNAELPRDRRHHRRPRPSARGQGRGRRASSPRPSGPSCRPSAATSARASSSGGRCHRGDFADWLREREPLTPRRGAQARAAPATEAAGERHGHGPASGTAGGCAAAVRAGGGGTLAAAVAMHGGLRAVAGVPLGRPPASGPDRGPGVLPGERAAGGTAPGGCRGAPTSAGHTIPGVAAALGRDLALPAR